MDPPVVRRGPQGGAAVLCARHGRVRAAPGGQRRVRAAPGGQRRVRAAPGGQRRVRAALGGQREAGGKSETGAASGG